MTDTTYFGQKLLPPSEAKKLPVRVLAHLGDAVFALCEREKEVLRCITVKEMHETTAARASAVSQSQMLDGLLDRLTGEELELVRRAKNIKARRMSRSRPYREATALEALLGYLYLCQPARLRELLSASTAQLSGSGE